jgi:hypothetical protein
MIILRINGGLGNQMFQYAFGRFLADKYDQRMCIDFSQFINSNRSYSLDMFPLKADILYDYNSEDLKYCKIFHLKEQKFEFNKQALNIIDRCNLKRTNILVSGYWQSPKYFCKIQSILENDFRHIYSIETSYQLLYDLIINSKSVMIHIRRGDYLHFGNQEKHGVININYIKAGIKYYREVLSNVLFFVFSDDINWCRENLPHEEDVYLINEDLDQGKTSFSLMRHCKYFIISNSTFSWWAAYLSNFSDKKVICPKKWFNDSNINTKDLIPTNWIKM